MFFSPNNGCGLEIANEYCDGGFTRTPVKIPIS